jgi:hypothetical protein
MKHRFIHEFEDAPPLGDFDVDIDLPPGARLRIDVDQNGIWVSGDRAGWLHLARIAAEMGMQSQLENGYHFHRSADWRESRTPVPEVTFELWDGTPPA